MDRERWDEGVRERQGVGGGRVLVSGCWGTDWCMCLFPCVCACVRACVRVCVCVCVCV